MKLTWYGHSTFRLDLEGASVLLDPYFTGNPAFKGELAEASQGVTHILLTHGHSDHVGDAVEISKNSGAVVIGQYDLLQWLGGKGLEKIDPMNMGGTLDQGAFHVTMVRAHHSSSVFENGVMQGLGDPAGFVIAPAKGPVVYAMGDTDIFGDMALIAEQHQPEIVLTPIGDRFTMGPKTAALAVTRFFHTARTIIPCHYGTFPMLTGTVAAFEHELGVGATKMLELQNGQPVEF